MNDKQPDLMPEVPDTLGVPEFDTERAADLEAFRSLSRDDLLKWVAANLAAGVDFEESGKKFSLWQPGAEKICIKFGLRPFFPDVVKYVDACVGGASIEEVLLRCYVVDDNHTIIGQGSGARSSVRTERGNDYRDLNYAIKMAQKSAQIDAVKRATGLSSVFTQDHPAEDQDLTAIKGKPEEGYLLQVAADCFGREQAEPVLESLALRRFRIKDGDWTQIPMHRVEYAARSLRQKATEETENQGGDNGD